MLKNLLTFETDKQFFIFCALIIIPFIIFQIAIITPNVIHNMQIPTYTGEWF